MHQNGLYTPSSSGLLETFRTIISPGLRACVGVKGVKSRLLTYLIRLFGTSPSGIGYTIGRAEVITKDNKYQLIDSLTLC
jgi:hypothetical protein